ncbi:MAG: hypothetical protein HQL51_01730 [Magnetococcales bacterium]|nr:hypothetical protein [Magnetococcales bacterium]
MSFKTVKAGHRLSIFEEKLNQEEEQTMGKANRKSAKGRRNRGEVRQENRVIRISIPPRVDQWAKSRGERIEDVASQLLLAGVDKKEEERIVQHEVGRGPSQINLFTPENAALLREIGKSAQKNKGELLDAAILRLLRVGLDAETREEQLTEMGREKERWEQGMGEMEAAQKPGYFGQCFDPST